MTFQERYQYNPKTDLLGKGGFARVYKAKDTLLNRVVALKFFINTNEDKHTLIAEISKAISFEHPNLCRYYDAALIENVNLHGEVEKTEVGVMEYLDGGNLKTYVTQHPEYLNKLLIDVLNGLAYLHKNGIIHRDLKPQNILIKNTPDGPVAKITDFGISKQTESDNSSSAIMGTIEYMAPEQFNPKKYGIDGKIDTNLDLWSFAMMVYELVTGAPMFGSRNTGASAEQLMSNILSDINIEELTRLPEPYRSIVKQGLIKDAKQRIRKAEGLIKIMEQGNTEESAGETLVMPKSSKKNHKPPEPETLVLPPKVETVPPKPPNAPPTSSKKPNVNWFIIGGVGLVFLIILFLFFKALIIV